MSSFATANLNTHSSYEARPSRLSKITLPNYTLGEERLNSLTHATGALFGAVALVMCLTAAKSAWAIAGSIIYGVALMLLYSVSATYHAMRDEKKKKFMRVVDHCTIYLLIAGTYTPILWEAIRPVSAKWAWIIFAIVWGLAVIAATLTALDMKKYSKFSMACYIGMGWSILIAWDTALAAIDTAGIILLVGGGVVYTIGAAVYGIGKKHRYIHSLFHLFVLGGTVLQFLCIYLYVL